jgi:dTDP-4-amino-4,6-dideoxygalactose transaminase
MTTLAEVRIPFIDLRAQYDSIREEVLTAFNGVLDSAHFVGGDWVEQFEEEFARAVGARYAIGVGSGTAALELSLEAAGIGSGAEVIVPANSFFATAEAVSNVGAIPVFADVDPLTFHLDVFSVQRRITDKTRAIIPVHLFGRAMDLTEIERLAAVHGLLIIEDACQAHGVKRAGVSVGGSALLACFSFYPGKNLGAYGDAGAITCNDAENARKLRILRDHGSPSKYQHTSIGTNSRLDALQAAVLSVKLRHLQEWNALRVRHAKVLSQALQNDGIRPPLIPSDGEHNFHLFVIRTRHRDALKNFLRERGIDTGIHYPVPLHLTPAYQELGYPRRGALPVAEALADEILSLPMYAELSEEQLGHLVSSLKEFSNRALSETGFVENIRKNL